jgi:hypothetical protein
MVFDEIGKNVEKEQHEKGINHGLQAPNFVLGTEIVIDTKQNGNGVEKAVTFHNDVGEIRMIHKVLCSFLNEKFN